MNSTGALNSFEMIETENAADWLKEVKRKALRFLSFAGIVYTLSLQISARQIQNEKDEKSSLSLFQVPHRPQKTTDNLFSQQ